MKAIYPTPRLAALLAVVAVSIGVASLWGLGRAVTLLCGLGLLPVALDAAALWRRRRPGLRRPAQLKGSLRRPLDITMDVEAAPGVVGVAPLGLRSWVGPLAPRAGAGLSLWRVVPRRRGLFDAGPVWLRVDSPLGLWSRRFIVTARSEVRIAPDLRGPADDVLGRELEDSGARLAGGATFAGTELRGLRSYQVGDDVRHIDWKATARAGQPVVREWEPERRRAVVLVIDAGRLMRAESDGESKLDAALRAVARVALAAERRGDRVGALVFSDRVARFVPPLSGSGQAERLVRYLGDVQPEGVESELGQALPQLLGLGRRALVIVITDVLDASGAGTLTATMAQLSARHVPLVALVRDPHFDAAMAAPVTDPAHAYRRAAAELAAAERARAIDLLRARGVRAVDLSMRALALHVVRGYAEARGDRL